MKKNIDMLGSGVILVFFCESDSGLIVRKKDGQVESDAKNLQDELTKPKRLLYCISHCDVIKTRNVGAMR